MPTEAEANAARELLAALAGRRRGSCRRAPERAIRRSRHDRGCGARDSARGSARGPVLTERMGVAALLLRGSSRRAIGAVAQRSERAAYIRDVGGSNPPGPTDGFRFSAILPEVPWLNG